MLFDAKAPGNFVTYKVTIPSAGTYDVKVGTRKGNRSGIVQLAIDGVDQGSAQDNYAAEADYEVIDLGKVTFTKPARGNSGSWLQGTIRPARVISSFWTILTLVAERFWFLLSGTCRITSRLPAPAVNNPSEANVRLIY